MAGTQLKTVVKHLGSLSVCDQLKAMNEADIVAGLHGADLTSFLFLREG